MKQQMKTLLRKVLARTAFVKPVLEQVLQIECWLASRWVSSAHRRLMAVQWGFPPQPEHFDHHIDLFYQWLASRNSLWLERGVFGSLALQGGDVLELACGDGFNARNFYSFRSRRVIACDFDPKAINTARRKNTAPNVEFVLADIRSAMPDGKFENIVWDAAIEHFTPDEIQKILKDIKSRLTSEGILSGYTIVEKSDGTKSLSHHEYEFRSKEDLLRFLTPHFKNVTVFETIYPSRHNLYFWASDGCLPFRSDWPNVISESRE
jgi:SAM-dependent methyltransferase